MDANSQYDDLCMETFMDVCNYMLYVDHAGAICLTHEERLSILSVRPGGRELIMEKGLENALNRNNQHLVGSRVRVDSDGRLSRFGRYYIEALDFINCRPWEGVIVEMEEGVKHGADASKIGYEALVNRYFPYHPPARGTLCILQDSFRRLVDLGFNMQACDFRQVISTANMEWGQSFWPRYVSVGNTMPFQGEYDASSQRMQHIWTLTGDPLYIVGEPEEEDE